MDSIIKKKPPLVTSVADHFLPSTDKVNYLDLVLGIYNQERPLRTADNFPVQLDRDAFVGQRE